MARLEDLADDDLVRQMCGDDSRAAAGAYYELHRRYAPMLLALVHRRLRDGASADAEDVAQDAWLIVWQKLKTQFRTHENLRGWIMTIAVNRATDALRKVRQSQLADAYVVTSQAEDSAAVARGEALRDCIENLDDERRTVVKMWLDQRTHDQISAALNIAPNTSMTRLHRAKELLRRCVERKLS
jgi:RNA polymerase sigma-70 factor (ECF subfamily)